MMDDFAIYDKVMDACDVAAHYAARTNYSTYEAEVSADSPLLWLKFDDPSTDHGEPAGIDGLYVQTGGGPITQVTGFHADSNAINIPDTVAGAAGHCVDVWDGNGDFGEDTDGDVTIELWVNFIDISGEGEPDNDYPRFFQHNGGWNELGGYGMMVNGPNQLGVIGGGQTNYMSSPADINDSNWHHIVVTYDSFYLPCCLYDYPNEVMVDCPALYLRFDDLTDSSGNNYWVDANSNVTLQQTKGSMGSCALLNGGWVAAANTTYEPCMPTDYDHIYAFGGVDACQLTVEFWLYYPSGDVNEYAAFFNQCDDADPRYSSPTAERGGSFSMCRMQFGDNRESFDGGYTYTAEGAWPTDADNWHHFVVIWDTEQDVNGNPVSTTVKWYTDNVNYKNSTYTYPAVADGVIGPEMNHILIGNLGSRDNPGNVAYTQYIDEFAVYPYVLSEERIETHYLFWAPQSCDELWDRQMAGEWEGIDRNQDCYIDFLDYASFALEWLLCNDPAIGPPDCPPNWPPE